uniref:Uncharacterized protein n=1 Tax=Leersia perrieri TaxID=77586 RepID=A0A0D9WQC0_9ORYZ
MVRHAAAAGGSVPASPGCGCSAISSFCFHEQDSRSERVTMVQSILQINHMLRKWIDGSHGGWMAKKISATRRARWVSLLVILDMGGKFLSMDL